MQVHLLLHDRNKIVIQVENECITSWTRLIIVKRSWSNASPPLAMIVPFKMQQVQCSIPGARIGPAAVNLGIYHLNVTFPMWAGHLFVDV